MKRTVRVALGSVVALLACDGVPVAPGNTGRLVVATVSQASVALDAGKVIVVGPSSSPTTKTVNATPGQTVRIDDLQPGSYTVALQGFVGGAAVARLAARHGAVPAEGGSGVSLGAGLRAGHAGAGRLDRGDDLAVAGAGDGRARGPDPSGGRRDGGSGAGRGEGRRANRGWRQRRRLMLQW